MTTPTPTTNMLSDNQIEVITNRINAEADIPFLREEQEGKIIDRILDFLNPKIQPALNAICPTPYVDCLKIALTEGLPTKDKRSRISTILRDQLEEPLSRQLAADMDIALVPENAEAAVMRVVAQKIIEEFVAWTVGEVDELLPARLKETRVAAGVQSEKKDGCNVA